MYVVQFYHRAGSSVTTDMPRHFARQISKVTSVSPLTFKLRARHPAEAGDEMQRCAITEFHVLISEQSRPRRFHVRECARRDRAQDRVVVVLRRTEPPQRGPH